MNKIIKILAIICLVSCLACLVACDQVDENDPTALKPFAAPDPNNPYDVKYERRNLELSCNTCCDCLLVVVFTNTESINNLFHDFVPEDFPELDDVPRIVDTSIEKTAQLRQDFLNGNKDALKTYNRKLLVHFDFHDFDRIIDAYDKLYVYPWIQDISPVISDFGFSTKPNDAKYSTRQQNVMDLINLEDAGDHTTGSSSVKVGVLDSGITSTHTRFNREP